MVTTSQINQLDLSNHYSQVGLTNQAHRRSLVEQISHLNKEFLQVEHQEPLLSLTNLTHQVWSQVELLQLTNQVEQLSRVSHCNLAEQISPLNKEHRLSQAARIHQVLHYNPVQHPPFLVNPIDPVAQINLICHLNLLHPCNQKDRINLEYPLNLTNHPTQALLRNQVVPFLQQLKQNHDHHQLVLRNPEN